MIKRILVSLLAIVLLVGWNVSAVGAETGFVVQTLEFDRTGYAEISGYVEGGVVGDVITFLVFAGDDMVLTAENLVYVDQQKLGNNGTFLFEFYVSSKWSETEVTVRLGGFAGATFNQSVLIPELPPELENVVNNSVMYGMDVYTVDSIYLAGEYVADSIATGGNVIYFKLGGCWYDLLDKDATSSAYLVPENAVEEAILQKLPLRWYYVQGRKAEFRQQEE